jgi:hypothetical protein
MGRARFILTPGGWRCEGDGFFATGTTREEAHLIWHELREAELKAWIHQARAALDEQQVSQQKAFELEERMLKSDRRKLKEDRWAFEETRERWNAAQRREPIQISPSRLLVVPQPPDYVIVGAAPRYPGDEAVIRTASGILVRVWLHASGWLVQCRFRP